MADYLMKSNPAVEKIDTETSATVRRILADIQTGGEDAVRRYARDLDGWAGDIVLGEERDYAEVVYYSHERFDLGALAGEQDGGR